MREWLLALGISLGSTLVLELFFAWLWGLRRQDLVLCILVNLLTNPPVVLFSRLWRLYVNLPLWWFALFLELAAVFLEGLWYRQDGRHIAHPYLFSLCANAFSFGLGLLIQLL